MFHCNVLENPGEAGRTNMALGIRRWTSSSSSTTIILDMFLDYGSQLSHVLEGMKLNFPRNSKLVSFFLSYILGTIPKLYSSSVEKNAIIDY